MIENFEKVHPTVWRTWNKAEYKLNNKLQQTSSQFNKA